MIKTNEEKIRELEQELKIKELKQQLKNKTTIGIVCMVLGLVTIYFAFTFMATETVGECMESNYNTITDDYDYLDLEKYCSQMIDDDLLERNTTACIGGILLILGIVHYHRMTKN